MTKVTALPDRLDFDLVPHETLLEAALDSVLDRLEHPHSGSDAGGRQQYSTRAVDITVPMHTPDTTPA